MIWTLFFLLSPALAAEPLVLKPGFVRKLHCEGKLYLSSIGNPNLVELQALPKEIGCGVFGSTLASTGETDLILETSVGTISRVIEIRAQELPSLTLDPLRPEALRDFPSTGFQFDGLCGRKLPGCPCANPRSSRDARSANATSMGLQ